MQKQNLSLDRIDRRRPENALERVARESEKQDEARISKWLRLAKRMLDGDDDPTPSPA